MQIKDLNQLKPCYFFSSNSSSLLDEEIENIKKSLKNLIDISVDFKIFNGSDESEINDFLNFYKTPSFFSVKKAAVIKNFENASASMINAITGFLEDLSKTYNKDMRDKDYADITGQDFGTALFITSGKDLKEKRLNNLVLELGIKKKLISPVSENIRKWLLEKSELDGIKFTGKAAVRLLENVNYDFAILKKEYQKLYLYIISEKEKIIDEHIVNRLVNRIFDMKIFDLVDFIGRKDKNSAIIALKSIIIDMNTKKDRKTKPLDFTDYEMDRKGLTGLITLLHRMYKAILYYKATGNKVSLIDYISRSVGHYPFIVNRLTANYIKFSGYYSTEAIIKIFKILKEYDYTLRTGQAYLQQKNLVLKMIVEIANAN